VSDFDLAPRQRQVALIMTDSSPGPGWWLASDGNWYPPHLHPDALARAADNASTEGSSPEGTSATRAATLAPTRSAESDAEILAAFHITADAKLASSSAAASAANRSPLDDIRETTGGGIDWEAVASERAAQRELRNRQAGASRRRTFAIGGAVIALIAIALIARTDRGGDDHTRTLTTPDVTLSGSVSSGATPTTPSKAVTSTTAIASTTAVASTTAIAQTSGATAASGSTGASGAGTNVSVFSLAPGSCIDQDNLTTGLVTTVRSVPCDQPHTHEVYAKTSVTPADQPYDAAKVTAFANQACTDGFQAYVGIPYEQSKYYFLHLAPSAESWNKTRDRDVVCLLLLEGQKLTSSVKGKKE
jgi:hypothetical protein